jgi:hypothetical protein
MGVLAGMPERSQTPGGCDRCNAYTITERDPRNDLMALMTVHHDDWCPSLKAYTKKLGGKTKAARKSAALRKAFGLEGWRADA